MGKRDSMDKFEFYLRRKTELMTIAEAKELEAGLLCDELKELSFEIMLINKEISSINLKLFGGK